MDSLFIVNGWVSLAGAIAASWIVLHPNIHEGLTVKIGMIAIAFSLLVTAALTFSGGANWHGLLAAGVVLRAGFVVVCLSVLWRVWRFLHGNQRLRRDSDWRCILTKQEPQ